MKTMVGRINKTARKTTRLPMTGNGDSSAGHSIHSILSITAPTTDHLIPFVKEKSPSAVMFPSGLQASSSLGRRTG
eukprot:scaffold1527_cov145-Skeletonema_menzelii.AAC.3